jgi:hydroxyacylglutathione hydrolase
MNARYELHLIEVGNRLQNHIYLLHCLTTHTTAAIDPTEAAPVLAALAARSWRLDTILTTHHHADHTDGNLALKAATGCRIIGSKQDAARIPAIDIGLADGESCTVGELRGTVIATSGHTIGHIAYFFAEAKLLFSGDALFSMGCGRIFEGTPAQAYNATQRLSALPNDTLLCPAHEYTVANAAFALSVEPENIALQKRMMQAQALRQAAQPTVPVMLATEHATNPFLRCDSPEIRHNLNMIGAEDVAVFARLRSMKDDF